MNSEGEPLRLFVEHTTACFLRSSEKAACRILDMQKKPAGAGNAVQLSRFS